MVSYDGLYEQLNRKGITKTYLTTEIGISSRTIAKIAKGEKLSNRGQQAAFFTAVYPSGETRKGG